MKMKRKFSKISLLSFLLFGLICSLFWGSTISASASSSGSQTVSQMTIDAQAQSNGDLLVTEKWALHVTERSKAYSNFYRTFDMAGSNGISADSITLNSVFDNDSGIEYQNIGDINPENVTGPQNSCYLHKSGNQIEIGWFAPKFTSGNRTFTFSYTIHNVMNVYQDVGEIFDTFVPDKFSFSVTKLTGTIRLPQAVSDPNTQIRAWLHSTASGSWEVLPDGTGITFSLENIPKETMVAVRMLAPATLFSESPKQINEAKGSEIAAEEQALVDKAIAHQETQKQLGYIDVIGGILFLVLAIFLTIYIRKKYFKPYQLNSPEYYREIPKEASPGGIAKLFYYYDGGVDLTQEQKGRVYSATLLSLARKGYVNLIPDQNEKEFRISITDDKAREDLTQSEAIFQQLFSNVAEHYNGSFSMKDFKQYAKKQYVSVDSLISRFWVTAEREHTEADWYEKRPKAVKAFIAIASMAAVLGIVLFVVLLAIANLTMIYLPLGMLIGGIILAVSCSSKKPRLTKKGQTEWDQWHGLKKYMLDFSNLKEYEVPQLALWEEYLVYATMMGISKRVAKQLKLVYPQLNTVDYQSGNWMYTYFWYGNFYHYNYDFGEQFSSSMNQITQAATRLAHPSISSSTGSGFGGGSSFGGFGGGGFGGGGGGCR
ncbi:DUF2207 domain-containing protein [Caproicibacterium sp. BJN0003]|uniref:DUF2207 domain-containing protein n=1 Tax=Caproicibacterium sp. BJN0003 TaxID=2994078 RepID=UPI002251BAF8|nr:DUF2207 domain-containing protein [Caproicibacterium sp. BJN0003]UZT82949.1 DUF2207 domain-containing protein [Caproicibacterium sp. BJN0003]